MHIGVKMAFKNSRYGKNLRRRLRFKTKFLGKYATDENAKRREQHYNNPSKKMVLRWRDFF